MAVLKTRRTGADVNTFIESVADPRRRHDAEQMLALLEEVTGEPPAMWGDSIVGFGSYHYRYESGREGDWFLVGFSPRKANLVLYLMSGLSRHRTLLSQIGKHKTGRSCLYLNRLEGIDFGVLRRLVEESVLVVRARDVATDG